MQRILALSKIINFADNYSNYAFQIFILLNFTFGLIGPMLSFYSLKKDMSIEYKTASIYSLITFLADFFSILIVSWIFFKITRFKNYKFWLLLYSLVYTVVWIFDIFDISQYLRFLSILGLIMSSLLLFLIIKRKFDIKIRLVLLIIHILFYFLDAVLSEMIATNPILIKVVEFIQTYH